MLFLSPRRVGKENVDIICYGLEATQFDKHTNAYQNNIEPSVDPGTIEA